MLNEIFTEENIELIIKLIIIPILAIITKYITQYFHAKQQEIQSSNKTELERNALMKFYDIVVSCIECTNQTYADALRAAGTFDINAQKEALNKTTQAVLRLLTDETKEILNQAVGNLDIYLENLIESIIKQNKSIEEVIGEAK